jgi:hypothetical protein
VARLLHPEAVAHRANLPREKAQTDRALLACVESDGCARVEAVCDQVLRRRLDEAQELASAQRGVALVHKDHADARGARGAYLVGQLVPGLAKPRILVKVQQEDALTLVRVTRLRRERRCSW